MRILCSFPGRAGDLLWALPTVRAISEHYGEPVDLQIAGEFEGLVPLLLQQPYLHHVLGDGAWGMSMGWEPACRLEEEYDRTYHLGYRRWPELPLPYETQRTLSGLGQDGSHTLPIDLERPWITVPPWAGEPVALSAGWSDCYFEMKLGLVECLRRVKIPELPNGTILCPAGSRWQIEAGYAPADWVETAQVIAQGKVFLGDCSALHVLAVALDKPVVLYEPMEARWNPIFYPLGKTGRVRLVTGNDGLPTTDSRHTADVLKEVLRG